jgi:arylsulfatase A-like enzyme
MPCFKTLQAGPSCSVSALPSRLQSPKLKKQLADKGVRFANSFVDLCCPSRVSFLTGIGAHNHGVVGNLPSQGGGYETLYALGLEAETIVTWMQSAGYITAFMGKYMNGYGNGSVSNTHVTRMDGVVRRGAQQILRLQAQ